MNEQRHKDREISSGNAPRPFSPPSSSDKCDKHVLPHVLGTQTPGCPQSSPRLCRHLPLSISQGASLNLALIIRVTKTICNLFQYPNFKHRTCFFSKYTRSAPSNSDSVPGVGAASLYSAVENPPVTESGCADGSRGLTEAIGDLDSEGTQTQRTRQRKNGLNWAHSYQTMHSGDPESEGCGLSLASAQALPSASIEQGCLQVTSGQRRARPCSLLGSPAFRGSP